MMRRKILLGLTLVVALLLPLTLCMAANPVERYVDKDTLKGWLRDPQVLIIDVRAPSHWAESSRKIKGAVRRDPEREKVPLWAPTLPKNKKIVLYCS